MNATLIELLKMAAERRPRRIEGATIESISTLKRSSRPVAEIFLWLA